MRRVLVAILVQGVGVGELASLADELDGVLLIDEAYVDFSEETVLAQVSSALPSSSRAEDCTGSDGPSVGKEVDE